MFGTNLKKPAKPREIVMAGVALVISFVFTTNNFIKPKIQEAAELGSQFKELKDKTSSLQQLNTVLREKKQQAELDAAKQQPTQVVETQDPRILLLKNTKRQRYAGVSEFLQDISSVGFRSSVIIDSVKYDPKQMRGGYDETKFIMAFHGDYAKIQSFLKKLESVPALLTLESLSMNIGTGETQNVIVSLTGTFYQLEGDNV